MLLPRAPLCALLASACLGFGLGCADADPVANGGADTDPGPDTHTVGQDEAAFTWPDPLPPAADGAPALFKGLMVGTWVPDGEAGFDETWIDETGLREVFSKERAGRRTWHGFATPASEIPVDSLLDDRAGPAVGYLYSLLSRAWMDRVAEDVPAVLHVRHRGRARLFLDGELVLDAPAPPAGEWAVQRVRVQLTGPYDVLIAKLGRGDGTLGESMDIEVRVTEPDGSVIDGQTWNSMRPPSLPTDL